MKFSIGLFLLLNVTISCQQHIEKGVTIYYLIRHCEKERGPKAGKDPLLTEKGRERANFWARYFQNKNIDAVFSTDTKRTLATAEPTARAFHLKTIIYSATDKYNADFKQKTAGKTVLIVGHSNTTPEFVNKILGKKRYPHIDDKEFGTVFKVTVNERGNASVEKETINNWDMP